MRNLDWLNRSSRGERKLKVRNQQRSFFQGFAVLGRRDSIVPSET
jgi:hypothetical protein